MDSSVIAFAVLKIKRDAEGNLPADFRGWTNLMNAIFLQNVWKRLL